MSKFSSNDHVTTFATFEISHESGDTCFSRTPEAIILRAAIYGQFDIFVQNMKPFMEGEGKLKLFRWPCHQVKLLDLRLASFGDHYEGINVIEVASKYHQPSIIEYLYQNKKQFGIQSKDFVGAWRYDPYKGAYEIDAKLRETLIQDLELVAFIQNNYKNSEMMLGTPQLSPLSQVGLFANAATQTESTLIHSDSATQTVPTVPMVMAKETGCCTIS